MRLNPAKKVTASRAFTLIELLVVIPSSAFSLPCAPALSRAKERAHRTTCLNNKNNWSSPGRCMRVTPTNFRVKRRRSFRPLHSPQRDELVGHRQLRRGHRPGNHLARIDLSVSKKYRDL